MEVDENKTKSQSNRALLVQQVEEQSIFCDISVKLGHWEKRFHKCVLVASPFFENLVLGNFLEGQTGVIEMTVGSPETVNIALMFLYGKKPTINLENVRSLLELADYFILTNLKSACINYLRSVRITEENCIEILQLCAAFNFEIKSCIQCIESHLPQMFKKDRLLDLSADSVKYLLSDNRFSYVEMDVKIKFLLRWFRRYPGTTKATMMPLFQHIDVQEVTASVMEEVKLDAAFSKITGINEMAIPYNNSNEGLKVLVIAGQEFFYCIDMRKKKLFRLNSKLLERRSHLYSKCRNITGVRNSMSEIYFAGTGSRPELTSLNLATDDCVRYRLEMEDVYWRDKSTFIVRDKTVFAYVNKRLRDTHNLADEGEKSFMLSYVLGESNNSDHPFSVIQIGHLELEKNVKMSPVFSLQGEHISKVCMNRLYAAAFLLESKNHVIIFDLVDYKLERIEVATTDNDNVVQNKDGFLIFNNERCVCLDRLHGPSLSRKYMLQKFHFGSKAHVRYNFCDTVWFRITTDGKRCKLQFTSHEEMFAARCSSDQDIIWNQLPLPNDCEDLRYHLLNEDLFIVELPKNKLRCHIKCPHCELQSESSKVIVVQKINYILTDSDGYYVDSSDEEESDDLEWSTENDGYYYFSSD